MDISGLSLLSIVFELTIFGIFVYFVVLLGKQYVVPYLSEHVSAQRKHIEDLSVEQQALVDQREQAEKEIQAQQQNLAALEKKLERWHKALTKQRAEKQRALFEYVKKIELKKKLQSEKIYLTNLQKDVFPTAFARAQEELIEQNAGDEGKKFLAKLINELR